MEIKIDFKKTKKDKFISHLLNSKNLVITDTDFIVK